MISNLLKRFYQKTVLFVWDFFINKKDEKIPVELDYSRDMEEYKYFQKIARKYHKEIMRKKRKRMMKYHKIAFTKTIVFIIVVAASGYFIYKNYNPRIIFKSQQENEFSAKIKKDSSIIIDYVVNPKLRRYLSYISATEVPVVNGDTLASYKIKSYDPNSSAIGRYQMTRETRAGVGLGSVSDEVFLNWPELQDIACYRSMQMNYLAMKTFIKEYEGKVINGFYLTEAGMISLAHALGAGGAMGWIRNGCVVGQLPPGAPKAYTRLTFQKYKIVFK